MLGGIHETVFAWASKALQGKWPVRRFGRGRQTRGAKVKKLISSGIKFTHSLVQQISEAGS